MRDNPADDVHVTTFLLDGEAPRLAAPPFPAAGPAEGPVPAIIPPAPLIVTPDVSLAPPPGGAAPVGGVDLPPLPTPSHGPLPDLAAPSLPAPVSAGPVIAAGEIDRNDANSGATSPRHPMAHLMPEKAQPSEASLRAAQLRAAKKAKARRTKIIVAVVMLVIAAVVGPPLVKWLIDAVNEAGSTSTDEPVSTTPDSVADPATSDTPTSDAPSPGGDASDDEGGSGGLAGLVELPDAARNVVDQTNANAPGDVPGVVVTTTAP